MIDDYLTQLEEDKNVLTDNLTTMGITGLTGDETFTELAPKVLEILDPYFGNNITNKSQIFKAVPDIVIDPNVSSLSGFMQSWNNTLTPRLIYNGNAIDISSFWRNCTTLTSVDLSGINKTNMKNFSYLFNNCYALTTIIWGDEVVAPTDMTSMFYECHYINKDMLATLLAKIDFSNMTTLTNTFRAMTHLTEMPYIDTSNITSMDNTFYSNIAMTKIPQLNTSNVTSMSRTFYDCNSLSDFPVLDFSSVTTFSSTFSACNALKNNATALNNLLASLASATSYTGTKKISSIWGYYPPTTAQCEGLSNYQMFLDAGWTVE